MGFKLYHLVVLILMFLFYFIMLRIVERESLKENFWREWKESMSYQELMEFYIPGEPLDSVPEKMRAPLKRKNAEANALKYYKSEIFPAIQKMQHLLIMPSRYMYFKIVRMLEIKVEENVWLELREWEEWIKTLTDQELMEFYMPGGSLDAVPEKARCIFKRRNAMSNAYQYLCPTGEKV